MTMEDNHDEDCAENCSGSCDAGHSPDARVGSIHYFYHLVGAGIIRVTLRTVVSDRVLYRLLAEWNRVYGSRVSGKPYWIACNRHPSAEPSGSSHWFLRGPGLLKITCLRRFVCITDRRFSYLWRYVWQQPGSSRCTSIRGKP